MRHAASMSLCVLLFIPALLHAEYIEITLPESGEYACSPSEVRWDSDIDPAEGDVLEVSFRYDYGWGWSSWIPIGVSNNDGEIGWSDPPCWDDLSNGGGFEVRVQYTSNPSVYDVVEFDLVNDGFPVDGPYGIFIDFAGDAQNYLEVVPRIDPVPYTSFEAFVALRGTDDFTTASFAVKVVPSGVLTPLGFESLLPGGLAIGSLDAGVTLDSTECKPSGEVVYLARLEGFYLTGEADIEIRDHPYYPRWVVDCDENLHFYEVANHGGVGKEPVSTPVEARSWGAIKAMYRN